MTSPGKLIQRWVARMGILPAAVVLLVPGVAEPLSGQEIEAAGAIDLTVYEKTVRENLELRRQVAEAARAASDLRRENARLLLQVRELEQKQADLAAVIAALRATEDSRREIERLREEKSALERELTRMAGERKTDAPPPAAPAPQPGSALFRQLEEENARLRRQVMEWREAHQVEAQSKEQSGRRETEWKQRAETLTAENADLRRQIASRDAELEKQRRTMRLLAEKALEYRRELRRLRERAEPQPARSSPAEETTPRLPETAALHEAARAAIRAGQYREAERLYQQARRQAPNHPLAYYNLGLLYEDYLKDPKKAAWYYRRYLELHPSAPDRDAVRSWLVELEARDR